MTPRRWLAVGVSLIALDVYEDRRHGITASQAARQAFRIHTPLGAAAFVATWGALTAWLMPHMFKHVAAAVEAVGDAIDAVDFD